MWNKTLTFSTNTMNELPFFSVSLSVCQVQFSTQWQTKYLFFHLTKLCCCQFPELIAVLFSPEKA